MKHFVSQWTIRLLKQWIPKKWEFTQESFAWKAAPASRVTCLPAGDFKQFQQLVRPLQDQMEARSDRQVSGDQDHTLTGTA